MDRKPVLAVVIFLGVIALACIGGAIALTALDKGVPDGIWTTTGTAVGAIAAVLTSARYNDPNAAPAPVQVMNAEDEPVPTTDTEAVATVQNAPDVEIAAAGAQHPVGSQQAEEVDPATIPGYE